MIAKNLNAPLHESEERAIDRAIFDETARWRDATMSWKELAEFRKLEIERIQNKCDCIECENVKLRRELDELKERVRRYYKELRNED